MKDMFGSQFSRGSVVLCGNKIGLVVSIANDKCRVVPFMKNEHGHVVVMDMMSNGMEHNCSDVFVATNYILYKSNDCSCRLVNTLTKEIKNINIKEEYLKCLV